ncbi:hypothetical protein UFOVP26_83 [uncultured Caudovirales phage]|uniref:Uncharacterized protein n=1 Tax=uncultured Caudovirales phage TaxID=2100421 RepID=A0A6J7WUD1_9CAUD|nr:hypothetical protein UFOVP26_83 [uncultured Caudovirales phage]CAB4123598.1 hypothetical protein UFOVP44_14 [uncultured Caudovirales phage]CAB5218843.1 hypothetical protein UFOVP220_5 [uncultured Caudovirales phage]
MLFIPNLRCTVTKHSGLDIYGQPKVGITYKEKCAIVKLITTTAPTPIRADASASRGSAREQVADAELLFVATTKVDIDDFIVVAGVNLRAIGKFPRYSLSGNLDHYQILCNIWE